MKKILLLAVAMLCKYIFIAQTISSAPYCAAQIASLSAFPANCIKAVSIGAFTNNSGAGYYNNSEYVYYNNLMPASLQKGTNIAATFTVARADAEIDAFWVFIDYNMNNLFEATEVVGQAPVGQFNPISTYGPNVTFSFSINIPASAQTGQTRMRIIYTSDAYLPMPNIPTPCNSNLDLFNPPLFAYGEIEDYIVNITSGQTGTAPVASFMAPAAACMGKTVVLTDNSSNIPSVWSWTLTGATPSISTLQNPLVKYNNTGTFTISFLVANGIGISAMVSKTISISACTGIDQAASEPDQISVFPNPGNGYFNLACEMASKIMVYDISGKKIVEETLDAGNHVLDLSDRAAGMYFIIYSSNGKQNRLKLMKE